MQKCEFNELTGRKDVLNDILRRKVDQAKLSIQKGKFMDAIEQLDDASLICLETGEREMAIAFSEQAIGLKMRIGNQGGDAATSTTLPAGHGNVSDAVRKHASMIRWLKDLQQRASLAYMNKDYKKSRFYICQMIAIAKKFGEKTLIKNYKQNLKKIDEMLKN